MIKFKYHLSSRHDSKIYTELPGIGNEIKIGSSKRFIIEGENSLGKSFLMDLISYAFFGLDQDESKIYQELKDKIKNLDDGEVWDLDFEILIDIDKNYQIVSKKSKGRGPIVRQIINGKESTPISKEQFFQEFELIYDIPKNPIERMQSIEKVIKNFNSKIKTDYSRYSSNIQKIIAQEQVTKDTNKIKELEEKISRTESEIQQKTSAIEEYSSKFKNQNSYLALKNYIDQYKEKQAEEIKLSKLKNDLEKDKTKIKNPNITRHKVIKQERELDVMKNSCFNLQEQIVTKITEQDTSAIANFENTLNNFNEIDLYHVFELKDEENIWKKKSNHLLDQIKLNLNTFIDEDENELHNLFDEIIRVFENFGITNNKVAEVFNNTQSYDDVIKLLNEKKDEHSSSKNIQEDFDDIIDDIKTFITKTGETIKAQFDLNILKPQATNSAMTAAEISKIKLEDNLKKLKTKLSTITTKLETLKNRLPSQIDKTINLEIGNLRQIYNSLKENKSIKGKNQDTILAEVGSNNRIIADKKRELEKLKEDLIKFNDRKATEDSKGESNLNNYEKTCAIKIDSLLSKFVQRLEYLGHSMDEIQGYEDIDKSPVYNYIMKNMSEKILYQNNEVDLQEIDLNKRRFKYRGNAQDEWIPFSSISTGQNSSNYLVQLINQTDEEKYLILMLDEIGQMGEQALGRVNKVIERKNENGKLVFAYFADVVMGQNPLKIKHL